MRGERYPRTFYRKILKAEEGRDIYNQHWKTNPDLSWMKNIVITKSIVTMTSLAPRKAAGKGERHEY